MSRFAKIFLWGIIMVNSISELSFLNNIDENQRIISDMVRVQEEIVNLAAEINSNLIVFPEEICTPIESFLKNINLFSERVSLLKKISTFIKNFKMDLNRPNAIQTFNSFSNQLNQLNQRTNNLTEEMRLFHFNLRQVRRDLEDLKIGPNASLSHSLSDSNIQITSDFIPLTDDYRFLREQLKNLQDEDVNILRLKEETNLIVQKYENEIINLTKKFDNQFKKFELDQKKITNSNELLSSGVDEGLKNLAELNERTQKIELEFSKIIGTETEKVKS
ncbi:MAG: hypothetical protein RR533_09060 [Carnobacterium sp.]